MLTVNTDLSTQNGVIRHDKQKEIKISLKKFLFRESLWSELVKWDVVIKATSEMECVYIVGLSLSSEVPLQETLSSIIFFLILPSIWRI